MKNVRRKGFTLIEIMVVVLIIIVITSVTVVAINNARNRTRDAIITSSLEQIVALGETVYNTEIGYRELKDHNKVNEIENRIKEMGRNINLTFDHDKGGSYEDDYSHFCAYVRLFMDEDQFFCVDYLGNARIVGGNGIEGDGLIECSDNREASPVDCSNR